MCYDICIIIHKKKLAAVEILCVKNPNVSVFSDRVEPLFKPSKNMMLTNKSRKKTPKMAIARHPSCFVKILMQKYTKTLKNNTKIYSNNGYYDFVACNINGVTYVTCENIKIVLNQINLKMQISILCFIDKT